MSKIQSISAREILDSRGNPTIEATVFLTDKIKGAASVPSGASTGIHEACELRDNNPKRYHGKGVLNAVENVNTVIGPALKNFEIIEQKRIDEKMIELDGTSNKKKLGANAILAVSLACARAASQAQNQELFQYLNSLFGYNVQDLKLPTPCFNILNGGEHANNNLDIQEFMIIPIDKAEKLKNNPRAFAEKVRMGSEIFHTLGKTLKKSNMDTGVGDEGGYAPNVSSSLDALDLIQAAILNAGYEPGKDIGIGIDAGSSQFYNPQTKEYLFQLDNAVFSSIKLIDLYEEWFKHYPIISIEDGLAEDDWSGWQEWTTKMKDKMMLVGDDLFVTNIERLRQGIESNAANAILIKPNQIGSLTETFNCIKLAQKNHYKIMISHRSGETCDPFIADLAVAVGAEFIKTGSLSRGERLAKYNRLMEIESILNK